MCWQINSNLQWSSSEFSRYRVLRICLPFPFPEGAVGLGCLPKATQAGSPPTRHSKELNIWLCRWSYSSVHLAYPQIITEQIHTASWCHPFFHTSPNSYWYETISGQDGPSDFILSKSRALCSWKVISSNWATYRIFHLLILVYNKNLKLGLRMFIAQCFAFLDNR